ncbi:MAG TPA: type II CAAX endopeptidase family protein [Thermodesulfobacteriota bacterium]|nr:type II CAAX endopeptidase family protein [Thermodesulfobacteriota bacterium]
MKNLIFSWIVQLFLLLLLFKHDKNDGERELFKKQHWKSFDVAIFVLLVNTLPFLLALTLYILSRLNINIHMPVTNIHTFAIYMALLVLLIVLFKFRFKKSVEALGIETNNVRRTILLGIFVGLISYLLIDGSYLLFWPKRYATEVARTIKTSGTSMDLPFYFLVAVLLGPVVEEVIYRGIFYSPYRKKYGPAKAIIITSVFFSMAHYALPSFLFSLLLAALYEKTESIIPPIIAHSIHNLLVILSVLFLVNGVTR